MREEVFAEIPIKSFAAYTPTVVPFFHSQEVTRIAALTKPAPNASKEVLAVIDINLTFRQQAEFGMPISGSGLVAAVRALPNMGGVSAREASWKRPFADTTPVCGYRHITDVAVLTGAFPGTSAWSPPI
jgi:hypothetical protein